MVARRSTVVPWLIALAVIAGLVWLLVSVASYDPTADDRFIQTVQGRTGIGQGISIQQHRDQVIEAGHRVCDNGNDTAEKARMVLHLGATQTQADAVAAAAHQVYCP